MPECTCGTPSKAKYYVSAIIGHEDNLLGAIGRVAAMKDGLDVDVREVDGYYCGKHVPAKRDMLTAQDRKYNFAVLEYHKTKLR
jgi:hypothetical protein